MKKTLLLLVLLCNIAYGQFTISESSADWKLLGKKQSDISISVNGDKAKISTIDFRSKTMGYDPLSTFKSRNQNNVNKISSEIKKGNEGVKNGVYEFVFNTEPDTLEKLYQVIIDHFDTKKKEIITLTFPEGNLYLDFNSKTAFYAVSFGIDTNGQTIYSAPIVRSNVEKLFGKR